MFTNFEVVDNYMSQLRQEDWDELYRQKKFDFKTDKLLYERITMSVHLGLNDLSNSSRLNAWLLMLQIDQDSEQFKFYRELYSDFLQQKIEAKSA